MRTLGDFPPMYSEPLGLIYTKGHSAQRNYIDLTKLYPKSLLYIGTSLLHGCTEHSE